MSWLSEDRARLTGFHEGQRKVMEAVYLHYAPRLSALVTRGLAIQGGRVRVTSPFDVGAVVQETFTRAFQEKARRAYDGTSPYLAYLSSIARNYLLNERRVREELAEDPSVELTLGRGDDAGALLSTAPRSPDELAEEQELSRIVKDFLDGRTQPERDVFQARMVERRTQEDAAQVVGLTRIQVRRIEAHLRRALLERFQSSGYLERAQPKVSSLLSPGVES
jgi:RNA polymerase sigma-70 factor (ECF subfamily)